MLNANQKTVFVQDNDRNRARRTERIERLKQMGWKVIPARDFKLSVERCQAKDFDLVIVHEGENLAQAIEMCETLKRAKPEINLILATNAAVQQPYAVKEDELDPKVRGMIAPSEQAVLAA
jgi:DNA-binding response OmpR family regulator